MMDGKNKWINITEAQITKSLSWLRKWGKGDTVILQKE